MVNKTLR